VFERGATVQLLLVRHGQTQFNAEHRYLGALDPELNANGVEQAKALRAILPTRLDAVVCSPLCRARQTADILCQDRGLTPSINTAFRERHVGVFEGLTQAEAQSQFPELWAQNITRQWHAAPTGGETIAEVVERVSAGLQGLSEHYAGKTVALVAHGFVAKVIRAVSHAGFDDFFEWQLANGAVCEITPGNTTV
jgi:broad specificity phosphatase PhoE